MKMDRRSWRAECGDMEDQGIINEKWELISVMWETRFFFDRGWKIF